MKETKVAIQYSLATNSLFKHEIYVCVVSRIPRVPNYCYILTFI